MIKLSKSLKLEGFSLVEMLITMSIMMLLMLTIGVTFSTMVQTYIRTDLRTKTRNEVEFISELYKRAIRNSEAEGVQIYNTSQLRKVSNFYPTHVENGQYPDPLSENEFGNEVHLRSSVSGRIICFAFFGDNVDESYGYFVKSSMPVGYNPEACFNDSPESRKNLVVMDSDKVRIDDIQVSHVSSGKNTLFEIIVEARPSRWIGKGDAPTVSRRSLVQTSILQF